MGNFFYQLGATRKGQHEWGEKIEVCKKGTNDDDGETRKLSVEKRQVRRVKKKREKKTWGG